MFVASRDVQPGEELVLRNPTAAELLLLDDDKNAAEFALGQMLRRRAMAQFVAGKLPDQSLIRYNSRLFIACRCLKASFFASVARLFEGIS